MGRFAIKTILKGAKKEKEVRLLVDTGAMVGTLDKKLVEELGLPRIPFLNGDRFIEDVNKNRIPAEIYPVGIEFNGCKSDIFMYVTEKSGNILGANTLQELDAIVKPREKTIVFRKCEPYKI